MVQAGVGPYHQAAPTFPPQQQQQQQPTPHHQQQQQQLSAADSLSVAAAVKNEQIAAAHKQQELAGGASLTGPPTQSAGPQVSLNLVYGPISIGVIIHLKHPKEFSHHRTTGVDYTPACVWSVCVCFGVCNHANYALGVCIA